MNYKTKEYEFNGIVIHLEDVNFGKMETYLYMGPNSIVKMCDPDKKITSNEFMDFDMKIVRMNCWASLPDEPDFMDDKYSPESVHVYKIEIVK